ncbi:MerR family transcriptional regulator [Streptomyces sp. AC04842]|uniref:MerR family transcriptional regulator n=1 Tax=unclassified Streptomyces TaxID=2593676 RepID=UPI0020C70778|nr:MerR family transcriptional regulator [Streptomyces sp. AC04842]
MSERIEDDAPGVGLTTGEVARRLGVAPTTVRTWDHRYGLGPDRHTGGRHRRWTPEDVARLERMCALTATGIPPAEAARLARETPAPETGPAPSARSSPAPASRAGSGLRLGDARQECKGIARAALRLDAATLDRLLLDAIREHGLVAAWTEVIVPTLQAVGRKWESSGERYVEVEHFLSWHVSGALRRAAPDTVPGRPGATVVLACAPGENHTLALEVLSAALAERGIPVRMFGGALPVESLIAAVRRTGPAAVGLWAQSRTTASRPLAAHVASMEWGVRGARRSPSVLTLGPGWSGRPTPGTARPHGLADAVTALEGLAAG